jgi:hypothetical protein
MVRELLSTPAERELPAAAALQSPFGPESIQDHGTGKGIRSRLLRQVVTLKARRARPSARLVTRR